MKFEIRCTGPNLPSSIPARTISPVDIPKDPRWRGGHRLTVSPPLVAFDICWNPEEPLRILTFSRGDWEDQLRKLSMRQATTKHAQLWHDLCKPHDARYRLAPVYGGFAEGFETTNLKEAMALLDELS